MNRKNGLDENELANLGRVEIASAELENSFDWMIAYNTRPEISDQLLKGKTIGTKLEVLNEITMPRLKAKKRIEHFKTLMTVLKRLIRHRNLAIHGSWSPGGKGNTMLSMFATLVPMPSTYVPEPPAASSPKTGEKLAAKDLAELAEDLSVFNDLLRLFHRNQWVSPMIARARRRNARKRAALLAKYEVSTQSL